MFEQELSNLENNTDIRKNLLSIKEKLNDVSAVKQLNKEAGRNYFVKYLQNDDAKTRVNAVKILGYIVDESCADFIMDAYDNEQTMFARPAYLKALSGFDYSQYIDRLLTRKKFLLEQDFDENNIKHVAAELKELNSLIGCEDIYQRHHFCNPKSEKTVYLTTGKDTKDVLSAQVKNSEKVFCGVKVITKDIKKLSANRLYREMLFPLNDMKSCPKSQIPEALLSGNLESILKECHIEDTPFKFRLTGKELDLSDIAARIEALSKEKLINAPSDYEIEIKLIASKEGRYGMLLKLHTLQDKRFNYRKEYVAASMNPVNAAMMVAMVKDYLVEGAQVIDPFCGVGTLLIERNKLVKAGPMYGIDTFGKAIEGARNNTRRAQGISINYINRDYFDFTHDYLFDEIITDMPVLSENSDEFYGRFFDKSEQILKEKGLIIIYSGEKNLVKKHLRLRDNYRLVREFAFNSKEGINIFVIELLTKK